MPRHGEKTTADMGQRLAVHVRIAMRGTVAALSLHQLVAVSQYEAGWSSVNTVRYGRGQAANPLLLAFAEEGQFG